VCANDNSPAQQIETFISSAQILRSEAMEMEKIVECVPNISEGRDQGIIDAVTAEVELVEGVRLLDVDPGADTNRTVITFIGSPEGAKEAAFRLIKKASELIDMSRHQGAHPRMGATDVCPFVPVSGVTMEDCTRLARDLGERVGKELGIPVYLYENAASSEERRNLAYVRKGEYEALGEKLADPVMKPDYGPAEFNDHVKRTGATVIGAREFLIAYNVNLNTRNKKLAFEIALNIREQGRKAKNEAGKFYRDENGEFVMTPGLLKCVKAIGWYIDDYGIAQISINLTNYKTTPLWKVFEACRDEARKIGVRVTGSELVGLIPKEALLEVGRHYLGMQQMSKGIPEAKLLETAVMSLGLEDLGPFDMQKKVIEYRLPSSAPLVSMTVKDFIEEVSVDSPAPGGGSVSALAGALGAGLSSMVANLAALKLNSKVFRERFPGNEAAAVKAQELQARLVAGVDRDTEAFNDVLNAMRLPQDTDEDKKARDEAIQAGYKSAASVPLETVKLCHEAFGPIKHVAENGLAASVTDAAVGALMANAGLKGAALNVRINLGNIEDEEFNRKMLEDLAKYEADADSSLRGIMEIVERRMKEGK